MKVLWITNILLPDAEEYLGLKKMVVGGWMQGLLEDLRDNDEVSFGVLSLSNVKILKSFTKNNVSYFILPKSNNKKTFWKEVENIFKPDIIHIHGTEFSYGMNYVDLFPDKKYVVSIQGLVSVYERYYLGGLSFKEIIRNISFRDIVFGHLYKKQKDFFKRGRLEKQYIQKCNNIIGRTTWDEYHTYFINKNRKYFFCNESLRSKFYSSKKWDISKIRKHSIFISQASYPIKGVHQLFKAVNLIKDEFPDIKVYIGGYKVVQDNTFLGKLKLLGYGKLLRKLIKKYNLQNHIEFTGNLNLDEMIFKFNNSHVFVCPSSIENSSNSIGEAQMIGIPTIASYVGGIIEMATHKESGLVYRFEEFEMLAYLIKTVFEDDKLCENLSRNGIKLSEERHNKERNKTNTISIYKQIAND